MFTSFLLGALAVICFQLGNMGMRDYPHEPEVWFGWFVALGFILPLICIARIWRYQLRQVEARVRRDYDERLRHILSNPIERVDPDPDRTQEVPAVDRSKVDI